MAARLMTHEHGTSDERRVHPRVPERLALAVTETGVAITVETKNISASGAYCTVDQFLPPMTKLALRFELPDGTRHATIACAGVVVRAEPVIESGSRGRYHIAIFFSDLRPQDRSAIERYVRQKLAATSS